MMWRITYWGSYLMKRTNQEKRLNVESIEEFNFRFSEELELFIVIYTN